METKRKYNNGDILRFTGDKVVTRVRKHIIAIIDHHRYIVLETDYEGWTKRRLENYNTNTFDHYYEYVGNSEMIPLLYGRN